MEHPVQKYEVVILFWFVVSCDPGTRYVDRQHLSPPVTCLL